MADHLSLPAALLVAMARAAYEADAAQVTGDPQLTWDEQDDQARDYFRLIVEAAAAALLDRCQVHEEWGVLWSGDLTPDWGYDTLDYAQSAIKASALDIDDTATVVRHLLVTTPPEPVEEQP